MPIVMDMLPVAAEEYLIREDWLNTMRSRFHPHLISLLEPILREQMLFVTHRGRLIIHGSLAMGGSFGVISDSFGPAGSPIRSSIVIDGRLGSNMRVIVTQHGEENGRPVDTVIYDRERVDANLLRLLADSIVRENNKEEEQARTRAIAHRRLPPPPLTRMVSMESQVDLLPLVHPPPPPPPPITVCSETQTEEVSKVESGVSTPPPPPLVSVESQTVIESKEMTTQMDDEDESVEGEEMEIGRGEVPDELDVSLLIDDHGHHLMDDGTPIGSPLPSDGSSINEEEIGHLIARDEEEEEEMEEEEEEMEANDEDEEEGMMSGEMHLNQSFGFDDGDDEEIGDEAVEEDDDDIPPSRQTRKRRLSSVSPPPPIPPKQSRIDQFILPIPRPIPIHVDSMLTCIHFILAFIHFPKALQFKVMGKQVDNEIHRKWKGVAITYGHRRRMVENACHLAISRLTQSAIRDPTNEEIHKKFAKKTKKIMKGFSALFLKADGIASSILNEFAALAPRPARFRANRVRMANRHSDAFDQFKEEAATHLIRVRQWTEMAKALPY
ncbi:hypothetical protein PRIPAC_74265 [Pristionchus pacificus]|uniref:Uncharacterized protein n=1 Tax=Pristionchus pacificus TaxID=54126 RepID=A0A2A6CA92_PRIPA|nr:hypothetical protein PRIPAC_74265 [Pristionchus pacificus]|eukprot:PDM75047.1 hypothetical protein PRIPAC_40428 [Pristionchus pacificus]